MLVDRSRRRVVFLFDVDNTLLDNDHVSDDLKNFLDREVGHQRQEQYWAIFEQLRRELGYADYLGALQRYRVQYPHDSHLLAISHFLLEYPFANRLFPSSLDAVDYATRFGEAVILSDGDVVFQPHKVYRSGLFEAFGGKVLIYVHKEQELDDVAARFPADHYILVDDKLRLLTAVKAVWRGRVTTVFARQGHYALDTKLTNAYPPPDVTIARIGEFVNLDLLGLTGTAPQR